MCISPHVAPATHAWRNFASSFSLLNFFLLGSTLFISSQVASQISLKGLFFFVILITTTSILPASQLIFRGSDAKDNDDIPLDTESSGAVSQKYWFFYLSNFQRALFSLLNMLLNSECLFCSVLALYVWTGTGRHRRMAVLQILCLARSAVGHGCKARVPSPCGFSISYWVSHKLWFQDLQGKEHLFDLGLHGPKGQKTSCPLTTSC